MTTRPDHVWRMKYDFVDGMSSTVRCGIRGRRVATITPQSRTMAEAVALMTGAVSFAGTSDG